MSIALHTKLKELERKVEALESRLLLLEMQKQPVMAVAQQLLDSDALASAPLRRTISLRGKAA